jgi:hypothetical protein
MCHQDPDRGCVDGLLLLARLSHLLERHELTKAIFAAVSEHLAAKGELLRGGTIVDATLIAASPSTKNKEGRRDPEMTQSKKGNQWYFGMATRPLVKSGPAPCVAPRQFGDGALECHHEVIRPRKVGVNVLGTEHLLSCLQAICNSPRGR